MRKALIVLVFGVLLISNAALAVEWDTLDFYKPYLMNKPVYLNETAVFAFKVVGIPKPGSYYVVPDNKTAVVDLRQIYEKGGYSVILIYLRPLFVDPFKANFGERVAYLYYNNTKYELLYNVDPRPEDQLILNYEAEIENLKAELKRANNETEKYKKLYEERTKEVTDLKKRLSDLTAKYQNATKKIDDLNTKVKQYELANKELEERVNEYRTLYNELILKQSEKTQGDYIKQSEKNKRIGSALLGSGLFGWLLGGVFLLVGVYLYVDYRYKK